ncbi:solute carrier organic anion transporter family member 4A1 [Hyla sarda]|uniref:solute carrier organic anion transporter family member 4A1 n=1 Tax=Hyla sarda TaxID=327740 RepID=UPI0024C3FF04|nr:solute carrier organic anion transporter family member 4A1 [Hyla sarda]XP_056404528.1 solute carrier organic anion transporter family member 4A1 [Hyla sarda]XP_056404529.1 solute carrier organic anion transporter family member 4A1 [Hyla sarda]
MPHNLSPESSFHSKQELLCFSEASRTVSDYDLGTPDSSDQIDALLSKTPTDSYIDPFYKETSTKKTLYDDNPCEINFIPSENENLCGWGTLKPSFLQVFNTSKGVLFFLCMASFLQGMMVNGFINTVITSIERRFELHSYHSGLIASSYDIAACLCLTFVSYFGGNGHKPQWLGWGVLIMGVGSLVFALPQFTTSVYVVDLSEDTGVCYSNHSSQVSESASSLANYRYVFMLGQFLHGVGATPLYTLGVTYLDENVKSSYSPVYIGIFYTAAIVGPAVGYLMGGFFLNMYTELNSLTDLTPENPLWVGAWWIGFLGAGAAAILISFPILGYPQQLPGSQRYVVMRVSEAHQVKNEVHKPDPDFGKTIKDLPKSVLMLLKNPTFIFLCFAGATEATLITGVSTFGPKFLESQFSLSASEAATFFGYLVVPAGGGGTFLGGFIVNKLKLHCSGVIRFCVLCTLLSLMSIFIFLISCPNMPIAGVTVPYTGSVHGGNSLNLSAACNANCSCAQDHYSPVCGADGIMYYSACYAGCSGAYVELNNGSKVYKNCSCIVSNNSMSDAQAILGKCSSSCQKMSLFLVFTFTVILFTFLCSIPALTATLRCVSDSQRSFALGIQWILVRTLGGIPGPIAFGSMIDISCLLWQNQSGERGSCYMYQNSAMSNYMLIAGLVYKLLGLVFFLLALLLYKPPPVSPASSVDKAANGHSAKGSQGETLVNSSGNPS